MVKRRGVVSPLRRNHAEQMQAAEMAGLFGEDLPVQQFSVPKLAIAMQRYGFLEPSREPAGLFRLRRRRRHLTLDREFIGVGLQRVLVRFYPPPVEDGFGMITSFHARSPVRYLRATRCTSAAVT